jgi:hypothetical protein
VIERETIQEKIIHTTDHVHEVEHLNAEHHGATVAPAITMADLEKETLGQTNAGVAKAVLKEEANAQSASASKSELKTGPNGATAGSKKRNVPTEDIDIDAATKVGKLDATEASNPLTQ